MPASRISTPAKRQKVSNGMKKTPATRRARSAQGALVNVPGRALPLRLQNLMRFSKIIPITLVGGLGSYSFSTNGLFDPDVTVTGIRPLYFDQMMELYTHYAVQSSKITAQSLSTTNAHVMIISIDDDNVGTTAQRALQQGTHSRAIMTPGGTPARIGMTWNRGARFGVGAQEGSLLSGTSSTNPAEQNFYRINIQEPSAAAITINIQVEWEAVVIFNELKTVSADA